MMSSSCDEIPDIVALTVGVRGHLTRSVAKRSAMAFRKIVATYPEVYVMLHFSGWDDDPRALWEFPEVCRYAQLWARLAGVDSPNNVPAMSNLSPDSLRVLSMLGAFGGHVHVPPDLIKQ
jgi:hypothetical protein